MSLFASSRVDGRAGRPLIRRRRRLSAVSTDSRAIGPGQLFIALEWAAFPTATTIAEVAAKGAVAALVESAKSPTRPCRKLLVRDLGAGLGRLGALNRRKVPPARWRP
ncbi:hypothetical protein ACHWUR_29380 [Klebsiella pneumoniae]